MEIIEHYDVYRQVIKRVLADQESLPSLPSITLKIRRAVIDDTTDIDALARLIGKDPALSTLLMKYASSPVYKTASPANTMSGLISLMGFSAVNNIVMTHSIRSLFINRNIQLKNLYNISRNRQLVKAGYSIFFAQQLDFRPTDEILMASFLSEVGTLALLSALKEQSEVPDSKTYFQLCRHYSKSLGVVLLSKWQIDEKLINAVKLCGQWDYSPEGKLALIDIINIGLFHTVKRISKSKVTFLPPIQEIAAYKKLSPLHNQVNEKGELLMLAENQKNIDTFIRSLA